MIKTIEVDWDNPSSLKKLIYRLSDRRKSILRQLGYDATVFNGNKYSVHQILPSILSIYESSPNSPGAHYVYAHCDPRKALNIRSDIRDLFLLQTFPNIKYRPSYIGKGRGGRYMDLSRNGIHRKIRTELIKSGKDYVPIILESGLSEEAALSKESALIEILGIVSLSNTGYLSNLDEGLDRMQIRRNYSEPEKKILRANGFSL